MEAEKKVSKLVIKKGSFKVELNKDEMISVEATHDGIVFNFKQGLQLYFTDSNMPSNYKNSLKAAINQYSGSIVTVDLNNPSRAVSVEV